MSTTILPRLAILIVLALLSGCAVDAAGEQPNPAPAASCAPAPDPSVCDHTGATCECIAARPADYPGLVCCPAFGSDARTPTGTSVSYFLVPTGEECP